MGERKFYFGDDTQGYTEREIVEALEKQKIRSRCFYLMMFMNVLFVDRVLIGSRNVIFATIVGKELIGVMMMPM